MATQRVLVGGGLAGLLAARRARDAGDDVLLLEATSEPGGRSRTDVLDGFRVERGAWLLAGAAPPFDGAADLLLEIRGPIALTAARGLVPAISAAGRVWLRFADLVPRERGRSASRRRAESVADFARRRFGSRFAHSIARPLCVAFLGAEPERVGVADLLPALLARDARDGRIGDLVAAALDGRIPFGFAARGGMAQLLRGLAGDLRAGVRCGVRVAALRLGDGPFDARAVLDDGTVLPPAAITLAVPPAEQAKLLAEAAPWLADRLRGIEEVAVVRVTLGWTVGSGGPPTPAAMAFARHGGRLRAIGGWFPPRLDPTAVPPGASSAVLVFGGLGDLAAIDETDARLTRHAIEDARTILGAPLRPSLVDIQRIPDAFPAPWPGRRATFVDDLASLSGRGVTLLGAHAAAPVGLRFDDAVRSLRGA